MALIIFNIVVKYKKIKFLNKIKIYNFYIWSNRIWCYQFVHITIPLWALSISPLRSWTWCLLSHLLCGDSPTLSPCQPQPVAQSRPVSSYLFSKSTSLQVKSSFPFPSSQVPLPVQSDQKQIPRVRSPFPSSQILYLFTPVSSLSSYPEAGPPQISAPPVVHTALGRRVTLQCGVDAWPHPSVVWWRDPDGRVPVIYGGNYRIDTLNDDDKVSSHAEDHGDSHCILLVQ